MAFNIVPQDVDKTFKIKASEGLIRIVAQHSILTQKIEIKYKLRQFHQGISFNCDVLIWVIISTLHPTVMIRRGNKV